MIKYQLHCNDDHLFEGWFRSSDDFDAQAGDGMLSCPICGDDQVRKAIMAPSIAKRGNLGAESENRAARLAEMKKSMTEAVARARDYVEKNFDYVGDKFPEEARRIHYGETDPRGIFGEASGEEAKELVEEGVSIAPLPKVEVASKDDKKKLN